ncbi:MAG: DMT family transporter [Eubacteriales bacterium]|nr:DMT family transporter [Eubacteriales bacterium]
MPPALKGHLLALITISIWSSTFIISKWLLDQMVPLQILLSRFIIAIIFLSIIHPRFKKPVSLREELLFLAVGAALASYFVFENSALQWTYSSNVSLIVATIPFMTGILSRLVYKTPFFTFQGVIGLITAYLGVLIIIINGSQLEGVEPIGDLLAIGAALMFAVYSVFMLKTGTGYTLIQLTRKVFVYGFFFLILMLLVSGVPILPESLDSEGIASLFYLGIVASSLAFIFWNRAIQAIGPVKTNQYIYLIPVMTTVFAAILLHEPITWLTITGACMILLGLYLSEQSKNKA